ncbi:hypothetical protein PENSTE_c011G02449 [Penicillium steckii]|uniref:Uncharacterized protein n=1 Tax=Penicillium steckii TaxID=303698 RepID=A0A1V6T682_9EURO|nr:hypothetical protein PENSTE_c011G02449 [Penicillium steckii]
MSATTSVAWPARAVETEIETVTVFTNTVLAFILAVGTVTTPKRRDWEGEMAICIILCSVTIGAMIEPLSSHDRNALCIDPVALCAKCARDYVESFQAFRFRC